jgi:hypothetical protein
VLETLLADEFMFSGPTPEPLSKRACISMHKALWGGFPDLKFNLNILAVQGNVVKGSTRITGTHTGLLIPPTPGNFVTISPTNKKIALSEEVSEYTIRGQHMVKMHVTPDPNGGWPGIYRQLDIDPGNTNPTGGRLR